MLLADRRIELDPRPSANRSPVLPAVMLGHCPGPARFERLARDRGLLAEIAALGFEQETDHLEALAADPDALATAEADQDGEDAALLRLESLPIPIYSLGQFQALFPEAFDRPTGYQSRLAGDRAWLPLAVQDFFETAAELPAGTLKLWVIRVPESAGRAGLLPVPDPLLRLLDPAALGAFERALLIPEVGLLALPDLERLQVPADLADVPRVRLVNPEPVFLPCGSAVDDGHRERRHPEEMPEDEPLLAPCAVISPILRALARHRPDLQCLLTLPLATADGDEAPDIARAALDCIARLSSRDADAVQPRPRLHQIQFLFPYLRGADRPLSSPAGLIAGMQARVSQQQGAWRSVAGRPLPGPARPYPPQTRQRATALREHPGIGVLRVERGVMTLDDERLAGPVLLDPAFRDRGVAARLDSHYRSGEVARFLGWLRRELTRLGESLLFDVDPADPRPGIALTAFFTALHQAGALRGALPERAFRIQRRRAAESVLAYDIELAPAFPIDRIRLTFAQNRHAEGPGIGIEVSDG